MAKLSEYIDTLEILTLNNKILFFSVNSKILKNYSRKSKSFINQLNFIAENVHKICLQCVSNNIVKFKL